MSLPRTRPGRPASGDLIARVEGLAAAGASAPTAAAQLHLHPHALRSALEAAGRRDLFAHLLANQDDRQERHAGGPGAAA